MILGDHFQYIELFASEEPKSCPRPERFQEVPDDFMQLINSTKDEGLGVYAQNRVCTLIFLFLFLEYSIVLGLRGHFRHQKTFSRP